MTDELLPYYNSELEFLRKAGHEFGEAMPNIASRLRMSGGVTDDPHVERLIQAFAYLNARTRHKLDDDFPEITEAFFNIVFPHYLAPIPSASVVQFTLDSGQADQTDGQPVKRATEVETEIMHGQEGLEGETCRFRTAYPIRVWPFRLDKARYKGKPFGAAPSPPRGTVAMCHVVMKTFVDNVHFAQMKPARLRFHLHGQSRYVYDLYEMLNCNLLGIAIAAAPNDAEAKMLPPTALQRVGFDKEEGLLEYPARSFLGYRLLTEYFAFPQKFLFFDLNLLRAGDERGDDPDVTKEPVTAFASLQNECHLYFFFNTHFGDLEPVVDKGTFQLGCTPVVNLFRKRSEPIRLTFSQSEYRIVPDAHRPLANEIYSIDKVVATSPSNEEVEFQPFYSFKHAEDARRQETFWYASRRVAGYAAGKEDHGLECYLRLVDLGFRPSVPHDWTVHVDTLCLNRDLPRRLPFGGGQPRLQVVGKSLVRAECLTPFTHTCRPELRHGTMWRLISHLTLNHLSLVNNSDGASALREILTLYDYRDSPETKDIIEGLLSVRGERVVGRTDSAPAGACRGMHVELELDEDKFAGGGIFLFAAVLECFLGLYTSINSFSRVTAYSNRRETELHTFDPRPDKANKAKLHVWPPRPGERVIL